MTRQTLSRTVKITTASLMAVLFGLPGIALANQASIRETGPDSYNKIEFSDRQKCEVENSNNVRAVNEVEQNARSGNAVVGGSGWERYNPDNWAARGRSYGEWESAVNAYMAQNKNNWRDNWDSRGHSGGNTIGGSATSGDASNVSNNRTNISLDNSGACAYGQFERGGAGGGQSAKPGQSGPGGVLGSSTSNLPGQSGGAGGILGDSFSLGGGLGGGYGAGNVYGPVTGGSGGAGGGAYYPSTSSGGAGGSGGGAGAGGGNASISLTGPDSYNKIVSKNSTDFSIQNDNNVNVVNVTKQNATSGNATVSGNTTAGSSGSGGAQNSSGTTTGAGISN